MSNGVIFSSLGGGASSCHPDTTSSCNPKPVETWEPLLHGGEPRYPPECERPRTSHISLYPLPDVWMEKTGSDAQSASPHLHLSLVLRRLLLPRSASLPHSSLLRLPALRSSLPPVLRPNDRHLWRGGGQGGGFCWGTRSQRRLKPETSWDFLIIQKKTLSVYFFFFLSSEMRRPATAGWTRSWSVHLNLQKHANKQRTSSSFYSPEKYGNLRTHVFFIIITAVFLPPARRCLAWLFCTLLLTFCIQTFEIFLTLTQNWFIFFS